MGGNAITGISKRYGLNRLFAQESVAERAAEIPQISGDFEWLSHRFLVVLENPWLSRD